MKIIRLCRPTGLENFIGSHYYKYVAPKGASDFAFVRRSRFFPSPVRGDVFVESRFEHPST